MILYNATGLATGGGGIGMLRNVSDERKQAAATFLQFWRIRRIRRGGRRRPAICR
ncbi:hypothetical protein EV645_2302 [Kribbella rubisoli]|uniref:Uncharacterized protein n=1 Tax=Kribbella rubisoli TaxID=3075929 RepID=A0A4Q7XBB4_9ACTN|nr:hypothetical protein [Kribbella rubisoli]RZU20075.1 hypothetical protein EV645_2302 [Kribbella rubisoli]